MELATVLRPLTEALYRLDTRLAFAGLIGLVALQRLAELRLAERNRRALLARGAIEHGAGLYPWMVALHAAFLVAAPLEVWLLQRPFRSLLAAAMAILLALAALLRLWAIRSLGERWTTRVLVLPGEPLVTRGPYRFLRHPNYLAVVTEIAALPLLHGALITAVVFSLLDLVLLGLRISTEERALAAPPAEADP